MNFEIAEILKPTEVRGFFRSTVVLRQRSHCSTLQAIERCEVVAATF